MRSFHALIVVFCAAAAAPGQYTMEWVWQVSDTGNGDGVIQPGEHAVLRLYAGMSGPSVVGYAGSIFDIIGAGNWDQGTILVADLNENLCSLGICAGYRFPNNDIRWIDSFQLPPFFNPGFDASNPIWVYSIVWAPDDYSFKWVSGTTANHFNHSIYTDDFGTSVEATPNINGFSFPVVPAPGSLVALVVCGLAAPRWRR